MDHVLWPQFQSLTQQKIPFRLFWINCDWLDRFGPVEKIHLRQVSWKIESHEQGAQIRQIRELLKENQIPLEFPILVAAEDLSEAQGLQKKLNEFLPNVFYIKV